MCETTPNINYYIRFKMKLQHIKPYLFIIVFLVVPFLLAPLGKKVINNQESYAASQTFEKKIPYGLVIHGGAGSIKPGMFSPEVEARYKAKLKEALEVGTNDLKKGDSAVYVVIDVIKVLENSPLFNAGKGAVFTHEGTNEMDASIMNGINKMAGAVAGVKTIKNPITAAFEVMTHSKHVLLTGEGAQEFAKTRGLEIVDPKYFFTEKRWNDLQKSLIDDKVKDFKHGTVGCVVLDKYGNLAAGTSTGGMTNKMFGRVGDSPIIGAGTYADNSTCAVSATGHGEFFIRYNVTYDIAARMKYLHESVKQASDSVISNLTKVGGSGGVICIDKYGNINMPYNTEGMFRGFCLGDEEPQILLY